VAWCGEQQVDPLRISVPQLAQFLELKRGGGLAPSTIEGYRTVIAGTIRQVTGVDLSCDPAISSLLRSYRLDADRSRNEVPTWDLSLVLNILSKAPFEPIGHINMKELTFKTIFLTALATGKRRSELHALIRKGLSWTDDKSCITLRVSPEFVSKTQLGLGSGVIQPISLKSLDDFVGNLSGELHLCPVRAVLTYFKRVKSLGLSRDKVKLFVSYKEGFHREISLPTISSWIKKTIVMCYDLANSEDLVLAKVKAHQVRALAASQAFYNNTPIEAVLQAGTWACHNTFSSFYLKNLSQSNSSGYRLSPFVAAHSVVRS